MDFGVSADHIVKNKENEKRNKYLDLARELKTLWKMKTTVIQILIGALGTIPKYFVREQEELEIGERAESIQTGIVYAGQNTAKSPGDMRGLAVSKILMKNPLLMLVWNIKDWYRN